jgi:DNA-binding NarL/FixJ family response regulator
MVSIRLQVQTEHSMLGEGLRELLKGDPDLVVTVGNGPAPAGQDPVIVLLDATVHASLERCAQLFHDNPRPLVIMFGADGDEDWAVEALRSGARGILCKTATVDQLKKAIHVVREGQIWASKRVVARALDLSLGFSAADGHVRNGSHAELTRRESEIVRHAAEGLSNKEIANQMTVSEATVKAHLTSIFRKLSVRDRLQLVIRYRDGKPSATAPVLRSIPATSVGARSAVKVALP